jgi:hypothetical protein
MNTSEYKEFERIIRNSGKQIEFEAHVHSWLFPKSLFAEKSEWFRENADGKRVADFNMCVSNDDALSYLAERASLLASELVPDTGKYCWWTDDVNVDCFCHCPKCRDFSPSDQYMIWCNTVLSGIRKTDPKAKLCYIAYFATMPPPRNIKPAEGIFLEYAPILRDSYIPIDNQECEKNRNETAHLSELVKFFGAKDSRILEYWLDNTRFSSYKKPFRKFQFDTDIMSRDTAYYRSFGFESMTCFACWIGTEYQKQYRNLDLKGYVDIIKS